MSNITLTKLESIIQKAVDEAVAKRFPQEAKPSANAELLNFVTKPKKNASKKRKAKKVEPTRIELPEGWQNVEGMKDLRRKHYKQARAEGLGYKQANEAGLNAVRKALA